MATRASVVQVYLKHHNNPDLNPRSVVCTDYEDPRTHQMVKGCGHRVLRYATYPKEKGMRFDGPPLVVEQFPIRGDGAVIAKVSAENVHFSTCPAKRQERPTTGFNARP